MPKVDNFEIDKENKLVLVSINPKIFPLPSIFSASYMMLDQAFIVIDGSPETEIVVSLRPKNSCGLEQLARQFNDQLLNYTVNDYESRKTSALREEIVKQAFAGHSRNDSK